MKKIMKSVMYIMMDEEMRKNIENEIGVGCDVIKCGREWEKL
jgi:hypothetical protein